MAALLLNAFEGKTRYGGGLRRQIRDVYKTARQLVRLYKTWHEEEPEGDHDEMAQEWEETAAALTAQIPELVSDIPLPENP